MKGGSPAENIESLRAFHLLGFRYLLLRAGSCQTLAITELGWPFYIGNPTMLQNAMTSHLTLTYNYRCKKGALP